MPESSPKSYSVPIWVASILLAALLGWATTWAVGVQTTLNAQGNAQVELKAERRADKEQLDRIENKVDLVLLGANLKTTK